jgi:catechol 2,3-dioxygenase-like lactoylglutathione lyase family enzyme
MTVTPRLDLIGIVTADLARSLAFYRRLGIEIPEGLDDEPHVEVELPGLRLAWDPVRTIQSFTPAYEHDAAASGNVALAFDCGTPAGVDEVLETLAAAGAPVHLAPFDAPWGQRYASVVDPDGNAIDLFAALD